MMDASRMIIEEEEKEKAEHPFSNRLTFHNIVKKIIERQTYEKDTIIILVGPRRNGKSNFGLKIVREYIKQRKAQDPDFTWSWKDNFPTSRAQAIEKIEELPDRSFIFCDEGGDMAYRGDTQRLMNKKLIKLMLKSGSKRMLALIALPDIFILDPKMLRMATLLVAIPYRYRDICAFAFFYGKSPNIFAPDPFGLERIKRAFASRKTSRDLMIPTMEKKMRVRDKKEWIEIPYPKSLFRFMRRVPTYLHSVRFRRVDQNFENMYIKKVKEKQLSAHMDEDQFIKFAEYSKLQMRYETLLYNLYTNIPNMSYAKLERLHINHQGNMLYGKESIKKVIDCTAAKFRIAGGRHGETGNRELGG